MPDTAAPPAKPTRAQAVHAALRRAIVEQALMPGDRLPEDAIARSFGVSRTVVRAALAQLQAEGLAQLRAHRGAEVARLSLAEAQDIFDMRRCLEVEAATRLARQASEADCARLDSHIAAEELEAAGDTARSIRLAGEFHVLLAELAGNHVLLGYVADLVSRSSLILAQYGRPHSPECGVREHRDIVAALRARDPARAATLMRRHLDDVAARALLHEPPPRARDLGAILDQYSTGATLGRDDVA